MTDPGRWSSEATTPQDAVAAVWRRESARIVATLVRETGDFSDAEDLAQDALVEAMSHWPTEGIPERPGAWLLAVARRRAIDGWRRRARWRDREPLLAHDVVLAEAARPVDATDPDDIDDDVLRLVFAACHPILSPQARLALTLRTVAGMTTEQIARVLLLSTSAVQQRIVRAKRTIHDAGVPFEIPDRAERPTRIASVLQVVYLLFTEGYAPTDGAHPVRIEVAREALRLGRVLGSLMPREPEVAALTALMEFQASRFAARADVDGLPLTLAEQDRSRWDRGAIERGSRALSQAESAGSGFGYYGLQAAIAECHAVVPTAEDTDWDRIVRLYDGLIALAPSPVVALNRAVAVAMRDGPETALLLVDEIAPELPGFRAVAAVRGELLTRLDRREEAAVAFTDAASLAGNDAEARSLTARAEALRQREP